MIRVWSNAFFYSFKSKFFEHNIGKSVKMFSQKCQDNVKIVRILKTRFFVDASGYELKDVLYGPETILWHLMKANVTYLFVGINMSAPLQI